MNFPADQQLFMNVAAATMEAANREEVKPVSTEGAVAAIVATYGDGETQAGDFSTDQQAAPLTVGEIFQAFKEGLERGKTEGTTIPRKKSPAAAFSAGRRIARREESPETPST